MGMWDAMFMGLRTMTRGRDESMIEYGFKMLMQVLLNFSLGLMMAFVMFVIGLWSIVKSYQPNPVIAVLFFVCAAFSFVTTYLLAMYGAAAGSVYGVLKIAEGNLRLQQPGGGQQQQQRQYMNDRPHTD